MTRRFLSYIKCEITKRYITIKCQPVYCDKKKKVVQRFVETGNCFGKYVSNLIAERRTWE